MSPQEKRDQLDEQEREYFDRRLSELTIQGQVTSRAYLYEKINKELENIRRNRNAD